MKKFENSARVVWRYAGIVRQFPSFGRALGYAFCFRSGTFARFCLEEVRRVSVWMGAACVIAVMTMGVSGGTTAPLDLVGSVGVWNNSGVQVGVVSGGGALPGGPPVYLGAGSDVSLLLSGHAVVGGVLRIGEPPGTTVYAFYYAPGDIDSSQESMVPEGAWSFSDYFTGVAPRGVVAVSSVASLVSVNSSNDLAFSPGVIVLPLISVLVLALSSVVALVLLVILLLWLKKFLWREF